MVDLLERLDVLLKQEVSDYKTVDYLDSRYQAILHASAPSSGPNVESASTSDSSYSSSTLGIKDWREKICKWSYEVTDHYEYSREVVSVSLHYLDRFLATQPVNKELFQLAAMTTLFLAIKLFQPQPEKISMSSMINLSRGYFTVEQMTAMEMAILRALSWRVHPTTALCFVKHILLLLPPPAVPINVREDILEYASFLTELSVTDYFFVVHRPSTVALAAILVSMEETPAVSKDARDDFCRELTRVNDLDASSDEVSDCRNRLRQLYANGGYARVETPSPVCVSYGVNQSSSVLKQ